jgi:hypothetical protein
MTTSDFRPVSLRVTCLHMRHKLMYCDDRHAIRGMVDDSSTTRVFWCAKTQEVLGPDGQPTHPADCNASRSCYCHGVPTSPPTEPTRADQLA